MNARPDRAFLLISLERGAVRGFDTFTARSVHSALDLAGYVCAVAEPGGFVVPSSLWAVDRIPVDVWRQAIDAPLGSVFRFGEHGACMLSVNVPALLEW